MGMISAKCPNCGANIEIDNSKEFGVCNYCGTKVIQDKVVVEHTGNIKIDTTEKLNNLYQLARRAVKDNNDRKALEYYLQIAMIEPNSWEANFYSTYYEALNCKIAQIESAANMISNSISTTLNLIKNNVCDDEEIKRAVNRITADCLVAAQLLHKSAYKHFCGIDAQIRGRHKGELTLRSLAASEICNTLANSIKNTFEIDFSSEIAECYYTAACILNEMAYTSSAVKDTENLAQKYIEKAISYHSDNRYDDLLKKMIKNKKIKKIAIIIGGVLIGIIVIGFAIVMIDQFH